MLTNCSCEIPYAFIKLLDVQQSCNGAFTFGIVTEILGRFLLRVVTSND